MAIRRFLITINNDSDIMHSALICAALEHHCKIWLGISAVECKTVLTKELIKNHGLYLGDMNKIKTIKQRNRTGVKQTNSDTRNNRGVRNRRIKGDNSKTLRRGGPSDTTA